MEGILHTEATSDEKAWIKCHFVRFLQRDTCVIRIESSGALVQVYLLNPLVELTRACVVSAMNPVPARVCLGQYSQGCYQACELEVQWPENKALFSAPVRYVKKARKSPAC
jgi:hypothetical protein